MPVANPIEILLVDPLTQVTRKERTRLLAFGLLAVVIAKAGIVPTKISALGIEFTETNQKTLLVIMAAVVVYFVVAFATYAFFDIWRSIVTFGNAQLQREYSTRQETYSLDSRMSNAFKYLFLIRAVIFEFGLPVSLGVYAIVVLYRAK